MPNIMGAKTQQDKRMFYIYIGENKEFEDCKFEFPSEYRVVFYQAFI